MECKAKLKFQWYQVGSIDHSKPVLNDWHASLERSLRENLTAKRFFYGFFLIVFLNFWNVKWQNSTIAAF